MSRSPKNKAFKKKLQPIQRGSGYRGSNGENSNGGLKRVKREEEERLEGQRKKEGRARINEHAKSGGQREKGDCAGAGSASRKEMSPSRYDPEREASQGRKRRFPCGPRKKRAVSTQKHPRKSFPLSLQGKQ